MNYFEYKVVPAPRRGIRTKGAKGAAGRFANALETVINELAATGWEYIRAESLPADERHGITMRKSEAYQNVLIFRKLTDDADDEPSVMVTFEDDEASEDDDDLFGNINDDLAEDEEFEDMDLDDEDTKNRS